MNSNIQPNISIEKKFLKSLKATELFWKTYFQIKVNQEGVIISDLGESSREIFAATTHAVVRFSCYFHIFLHCTLYKTHTWKLFAYGKIYALGKIKSKRKSLVINKTRKKNKTKQAQIRQNEYHSGTSGAPWWRPDFEQRTHRQTKICHAWY